MRTVSLWRRITLSGEVDNGGTIDGCKVGIEEWRSLGADGLSVNKNVGASDTLRESCKEGSIVEDENYEMISLTVYAKITVGSSERM